MQNSLIWLDFKKIEMGYSYLFLIINNMSICNDRLSSLVALATWLKFGFLMAYSDSSKSCSSSLRKGKMFSSKKRMTSFYLGKYQQNKASKMIAKI